MFSLLGSFFVQFVPIFGNIFDPKTLQNGLRDPLEKKVDFWYLFCRFFGPKVTLKTPKMGDGERVFASLGSSGAPRGRFWSPGTQFLPILLFLNDCYTVSQWLLYCFGARNYRIGPVLTWKIIDFRRFAFVSVLDRPGSPKGRKSIKCASMVSKSTQHDPNIHQESIPPMVSTKRQSLF